MRSLMLFLAFPAVALAAPVDALKPMAFLAGHCWQGDFPGKKQTDEHCFTWLYDGRALRDTHTVRTPGAPDYVGETTYLWNPVTRSVEYLYFENMGGMSRGTMESAADALVFPATQFIADSESMTYRARWTRLDDASYEAWSEAQVKDGWTTMFRMTLRRKD